MPNEVCSKILATICPASELQYQVGASKVSIVIILKKRAYALLIEPLNNMNQIRMNNNNNIHGEYVRPKAMDKNVNNKINSNM